ncbi:MAG: bifunctional demethylmenaquinone methyltransferase/2-methoxy-6-polyprenyl-1,4-benzoquinol methylase UbiE [Deltaproteobacteria bacterium]|nr:bifunctional demethylmenaquinone methyltransferase/2-methoxy-6-polyprenyl-1,4-benzoquinol methylase UbiE [Deltaproteobacteria bacterium]
MKNNELPFVKDMFDTIAPKYDFLNRSLSMRRDVYWRRKMVEAANIPDNGNVLDVACGTCDVPLEVMKQKEGLATVIGADFSPGMLVLGKEKIQKFKEKISILAGDALSLPFKDKTFNSVTIAFGIRNIMDKEKAILSFHSCLKEDGTLAVLEFSTPSNRLLNYLYMLYFKKILPKIGAIISKDKHAYTYLPDSVINFPSAEDFAKVIENCGFKDVKFKKMTFGIVTLFTGKK